jgi:hypothetical protein
MRSKTPCAFAAFAPILLVLSVSEAAAQQRQPRQSADAVRAECFRQANEAAGSVATFSPGATSERNARGLAAYRECARRNGIRP